MARGVFDENNPIPEYSRRMTVAIVEAYEAHRHCTPRHLGFLTDPYLTNKKFSEAEVEKSKELLLKWILRKIFRCSNTRDIGGRTYLLRQVQNENNAPNARSRAFDEVVDCLAHHALGEEATMEGRQKVRTKVIEPGEERQELIYKRFIEAEGHGARSTNEYSRGRKTHVTVNGERMRVRTNHELGNYIRGVATLSVPWCVHGENVNVNVLMEVSSFYFEMPYLSMLGLVVMVIVTLSAMWIGKLWMTEQFQLIQDEPDIDVWEDEGQPVESTVQNQGPVVENESAGPSDHSSEAYEFESVITSVADTDSTDPWLNYMPMQDEDVWQEAERLATQAIAKAKAQSAQTVPAKYGSQQAPARWTDFAPNDDQLPKAKAVASQQQIGPPPPKQLPYPLPELTGDQIEQFFAPMIAPEAPKQMEMPKIVFSTHAKHKVPGMDPYLLYTAPKKAVPTPKKSPPPMKATPMKAVPMLLKTVVFPVCRPPGHTNPEAHSYPDPLIFMDQPLMRVPDICKICSRASTHSMMVRCYDCGEEVCAACATFTNETRLGNTRMSCRTCYILEQRMLNGIQIRHTVDEPEDHVGTDIELVFNPQQMSVVFAYYDMFTLFQMQVLFDFYGIPCREANKLRACVQYHRATLDRENMPTAHQLQTIRATASGQEPNVMPFEVTTYERCAVAIRVRTIEGDPFDGRETMYSNRIDQDYTPVLRLWRASFTAEPIYVNLNQTLYEEIDNMDVYNGEVHRVMVEYQQGADLARAELESAAAAQMPD